MRDFRREIDRCQWIGEEPKGMAEAPCCGRSFFVEYDEIHEKPYLLVCRFCDQMFRVDVARAPDGGFEAQVTDTWEDYRLMSTKRKKRT